MNFFILILTLLSIEANATRIKDITNIRGVRENQLVGYGLVTGLSGSGDSSNEFTNQSFRRMLEKMGVSVENADLANGNVAAVVITATLPPFARAGNRIDVQVSALGDSSSLDGGVLIQTPMKASDQKVYAVAQGALSVGSLGGHKTVARIPNGAIIERDVGEDFNSRKMFRLTLQNPDFTTAARISKVINLDLGGKFATARDPGTVDVIVPFAYEGRTVQLIAAIESLPVSPDQRAKVVLNERTGTVVMGAQVKISKVAISHGDLTVKVGAEDVEKVENHVGLLEGYSDVGELVRALNRFGVSPKDLITIIQNIKAAGALHGELEIL